MSASFLLNKLRYPPVKSRSCPSRKLALCAISLEDTSVALDELRILAELAMPACQLVAVPPSSSSSLGLDDSQKQKANKLTRGKPCASRVAFSSLQHWRNMQLKLSMGVSA